MFGILFLTAALGFAQEPTEYEESLTCETATNLGELAELSSGRVTKSIETNDRIEAIIEDVEAEFAIEHYRRGGTELILEIRTQIYLLEEARDNSAWAPGAPYRGLFTIADCESGERSLRRYIKDIDSRIIDIDGLLEELKKKRVRGAPVME